MYEYESKQIFSKAGIPVPDSVLIKSPGEIEQGARTIEYPLLLKGQILQGGRGKAGLVQIVMDSAEAQKKADAIFQGKQGDHGVESILIEPKIEAVREVYLGITIDRLAKKPIIMVCPEGGVEIEEIAEKSPEKISSFHVRPSSGLRVYEAIELVKKMEIRGKMLPIVTDIVMKMYQVFETYDAELTEINPLMLTPDDRAYAVDAKMVINDDALFRHPEMKDTDRDLRPLEKEAKSMGLTYVDMEPGNVAVISSGAGYTLMVLDLIRSFGGEPANFMDSIVDSRVKMQKAIEFTLKRAREDTRIRSILMLKTMSFTPLDSMMGAIRDALQGQKSPVPIVSCLRATGNAIRNMTMEEAERQLKELGVHQYSSLRDAVEAAVSIAQER
jgi:succinyl-CoA synthetase beta subunit